MVCWAVRQLERAMVLTWLAEGCGLLGCQSARGSHGSAVAGWPAGRLVGVRLKHLASG